MIVLYFMHVGMAEWQADWLIGRTRNVQWMERGGTLSLQKKGKWDFAEFETLRCEIEGAILHIKKRFE